MKMRRRKLMRSRTFRCGFSRLFIMTTTSSWERSKRTKKLKSRHIMRRWRKFRKRRKCYKGPKVTISGCKKIMPNNQADSENPSKDYQLPIEENSKIKILNNKKSTKKLPRFNLKMQELIIASKIIGDHRKAQRILHSWTTSSSAPNKTKIWPTL